MTRGNFSIFGLRNDTSRLCEARATCDDSDTASLIAASYASRGLIGRIFEGDSNILVGETLPRKAG